LDILVKRLLRIILSTSLQKNKTVYFVI